MFDAIDIKDTLFGRVGWMPDDSAAALSEENQLSRSGRYFQGFHHAVTLNNVYQNMETVGADGDAFNDFLKSLQHSAILNSVSAVFNEDTLIEQTILLNRDCEKANPARYSLSGKRGYLLRLSNDPTYCAVIRSVSLMFSESGTITLVFAHSNAGVLYQEDINVEAEREVVKSLDWKMYPSCSRYKGGYFYVYYESDIPPIEPSHPDFNKSYVFSAKPYIETPAGDISYSCNTCGLNLEICSYRDFTEVIKRNEAMFDTVIGLQMAASVIEMIIHSTRSNFTEREMRENVKDLYNELNLTHSSPEFPYQVGIRSRIEREIKRLRNNLLPKTKTITVTPCFT